MHIGKDSVLIPTGIRAKMDLDYVLMLFPRSSLGFKYGLQLDNSVGIIDSDYYNSDNEGHIMAKVHACKEFSLSAGSRFIQGVFLQYGLANEEDVLTERNGGIGSTDNI